VDKDAELVRRCWEGDQDAFRELVLRYEEAVYNLAYRMLQNREDARDAAQEIFLNVFRSLPYFRGECAFKTWLYRIASNECISRSKRRRRWRGGETTLGEEARVVEDLSAGASSLEVVERKEQIRLLHRAIDELPEKYRIVVVLHYLEGLAYEEIAEALLVPLGTVKTRLFRAKELLRRKLRETLGEDL